MQSNPAMLCYVDLEALVIVCTDAESMLNGAELLDVEGTEDPDLVSATYRSPATGMPVSEILPVLPALADDAELAVEVDEPLWKKQGHCCEACAHGDDCDGGSCGLEAPTESDVGSSLAGIAIPTHRPVRNPKRRPRIFSRRN